MNLIHFNGGKNKLKKNTYIAIAFIYSIETNKTKCITYKCNFIVKLQRKNMSIPWERWRRSKMKIPKGTLHKRLQKY